MKAGKRYLLIMVLLFTVLTVNAKNYYFSSVSGNDSYTATQAQNQATPWKTLTKFNSIAATVVAGDSILFKRGEVFYGAIGVTTTGTSALPTVFGAYGAGANPIINGFTTLTGWTSLGGGIWQCSCPSGKASMNMVTLNGAQQALGRYPNKGYLTYQTHSGNTSITSNKLTGSPNWTGAEVVIRKNHYIIDRAKITSQSGTTINYGTSSGYSPTNLFGFFIQNDPRTLDTLGEWYFDPVAKNMQMYFGSNNPSSYTVNASTVDTLVYVNWHRNYITFTNLAFQGSNVYSMLIYFADHIKVQNCSINFSGGDGINNNQSTFTSILNSSVNHSNNNGMTIGTSIGSVATYNAVISGDTINNSATVIGMGIRQDGQASGVGVCIMGPQNTLQNCVVTNTGYMAVWAMGDNLLIKNNFISDFAFIKEDAGGIYTYNNQPVHMSITKETITGNIVLNGIGARDGVVVDPGIGASGIYCDNNISNVTISNNTVANCITAGIIIHDAHEITISNNTSFNNTDEIAYNADDNTTYNPGVTSFIRNISTHSNILFQNVTTQFSSYYLTLFKDVGSFGSIDSNYYARSVNTPNSYQTDVVGVETYPGVNHNLAYMNSTYNFDKNAKEKIINPTDYIRFEYNATPFNKVVSLDENYVDAKNTPYSGQLTLSPYSSVVLIGAVPCTTGIKSVISWNP